MADINVDSIGFCPVVQPSSSHVEICPICKGKGTIQDNVNITAIITRTCHGCNGYGWVTVKD